jgi:arylsulfatase A-like enzyme
MPMHYLLAVSLSLLIFMTGCAAGPGPAGRDDDRPPNLILIVADDLGYGDLGSFGQSLIRTPYLDRMADEGLRFTQFYAGSTVCAPSRSVLMTGRHTGRTSVRGNASGTERGALLDTDYTLAELLRDAGYATGMVGKWALGEPGVGHTPND